MLECKLTINNKFKSKGTVKLSVKNGQKLIAFKNSSQDKICKLEKSTEFKCKLYKQGKLTIIFKPENGKDTVIFIDEAKPSLLVDFLKKLREKSGSKGVLKTSKINQMKYVDSKQANLIKSKGKPEKSKFLKAPKIIQTSLQQSMNVSNIKNLPESFPTSLLNLNLSELNLIKMPRVIKTLIHCKNITTLDISSNKLKKLPILLFCLPLKNLICNDNQILSLPTYYDIKSIFKHSIQHLNFSNNLIKNLPNWLVYCQNLSLLKFANNQLTSLPNSIGWLKQLKVLHVQNNKINFISKNVLLTNNKYPKNFQDLRLDGNDIFNEKYSNILNETNGKLPEFLEQDPATNTQTIVNGRLIDINSTRLENGQNERPQIWSTKPTIFWNQNYKNSIDSLEFTSLKIVLSKLIPKVQKSKQNQYIFENCHQLINNSQFKNTFQGQVMKNVLNFNKIWICEKCDKLHYGSTSKKARVRLTTEAKKLSSNIVLEANQNYVWVDVYICCG